MLLKFPTMSKPIFISLKNRPRFYAEEWKELGQRPGMRRSDFRSDLADCDGLDPERVQLTVHTTEPTGTVPEPFHRDHIARWSARTGTSGRSGTDVNTGNWNGSGSVPVSNPWCEHGLR